MRCLFDLTVGGDQIISREGQYATVDSLIGSGYPRVECPSGSDAADAGQIRQVREEAAVGLFIWVISINRPGRSFIPTLQLDREIVRNLLEPNV